MCIHFFIILQLTDILQCKDACAYFAKKYRVFKLLLSKWSNIEEIVVILRILYDATILLQGPTFGLSDFFGCWLVTCEKLAECAENPARSTNLAECLGASLNERRSQLLDNCSMTCAIYLDRRFSSELTEEQVELAKISMVRLWNRIRQLKQAKTANSQQDPTNEKTYNRYLEDYFNKKGVRCAANSNGSTERELLNILAKFSEDAEMRLHSNTNILEYWENKKTELPELYAIASIVNAIPPTQCQIERDFSTLSLVFNNKRFNLDQLLLEAILLIKLNPDLFYEVCEAHMNLL